MQQQEDLEMSPAGFEVVQVRAMAVRFCSTASMQQLGCALLQRGTGTGLQPSAWGVHKCLTQSFCRSCLQHEFPVRGHPSTPFAVATAVMLKRPDPDGRNGTAAREPVLLIAALADIGVTGALLVCQCRACLHQQHLSVQAPCVHNTCQ